MITLQKLEVREDEASHREPALSLDEYSISSGYEDSRTHEVVGSPDSDPSSTYNDGYALKWGAGLVGVGVVTALSIFLFIKHNSQRRYP